MDADVSLEGDGARLIAVGQDAAAVYVPGPKPHIESYNNQGEKLSSTPVKPSTALDSRTSPFSPAVADLPHHMTWFDGQRLYLLTPSDLRVDHVVDGAIGTPISVAGNMLMPTAQGIAVVNWSTGEVLREIDVDRSDYRGPVHLTLAGETIVETRGDTIVGLSSE